MRSGIATSRGGKRMMAFCTGVRLTALAFVGLAGVAYGAVVRPADDGRPLSNPDMGFTPVPLMCKR